MENNILKPPQYEKLFLEIPQYEASSKNLILLKTSSQEYAYFKDGYQLHPNTVLKQVMQYKVSTPLQHQFDGLKKYPFLYIFLTSKKRTSLIKPSSRTNSTRNQWTVSPCINGPITKPKPKQLNAKAPTNANIPCIQSLAWLNVTWSWSNHECREQLRFK